MTYLTITRGDDADFSIAAVDGDGEALDLTGATLRWTAKRDLRDADDDAIIRKTDVDGITVDDDPTTGLATLSITSGDTSDLTRETVLVWDMQAVDVDGKVRTLATGTLRISLDVTQTAP